MQHRIPWRTASLGLLWTLLAACGGGGGSGPAGPEPLVPGSGAASLVVPFTGVLTTSFSLTTDRGVRLLLDAGTSLRTPLGARITGPLTLGVDDGGGPGVFPGGTALLGTARVYAFLGPVATSPMVAVQFEPPARLEATLAPNVEGGFEVNTWMRAGSVVQGGAPGTPVDATGSTAVVLGQADFPTDPVIGQLPVASTGAYGVRHIPFNPATPVPTVLPLLEQPTQVHEVEIPGTAADTEPRICFWKLINPATGEIIVSRSGSGPLGLGNNESHIESEGSLFFHFSIVTRDGKRFFQVRTNYQNDFVLEVTPCGSDTPITGNPPGGATDESDETGPYKGFIRVTVHGWGGFRDEIAFEAQMRAALGAAYPLVFRSFNRVPGSDTFFASLNLFDYGASTCSIAALLPPGWVITCGNRTLDITLPCLPPTLATITTAPMPVAGTLNRVDFGTLGIQGSVPLGVNALDVVVSCNGAFALAASPDLLQVVDLAGLTKVDVPLPGLTSAVTFTITEDTILVGTSGGSLLALDALTRAVVWDVDSLPAGTWSVLSPSIDGAFAYLAGDGGDVVEIDLLRRTLGRTWTLPAADTLDVAPDGLQAAVVDRNANGLRLLDLVSGVPSALLPTGNAPAHCLYSPAGRFLLTANSASNSVSLIDLLAVLPTQNVPTGASPQCLATGMEMWGPLHGFVACFGSQTLERFSIGPAAAPLGGLATPPNPSVIRGNGQ